MQQKPSTPWIMQAFLLTQRVDHMDFLLCVVVDSIGVVKPAVIGIPLLAVHHRVRSIIGLWQFIPVLHFDQVEVAAVFLTRVLFFPSAKCPTLDAVPGGGAFTITKQFPSFAINM